MRYFALSFLMGLLLLASCKTKKLTIVNPQESIESVVVDCINLLEQKHYIELLSKYIYPDAKKEILENQTMEELAEDFKGKKADRLLKALKMAQKMEIEYIKEGEVGIIKLGEDFEGPGKIEFMKKDNLWYIAD